MKKVTETNALILDWMRECACPDGQQMESDAANSLSDFLRTHSEAEALKLIAKNGVNRNLTQWLFRRMATGIIAVITLRTRDRSIAAYKYTKKKV